MKFWEAVKLLDEGKSIRCKSWAKDDFWRKTNFGNLAVEWKREDFHYRLMKLIDEEWELYEQPERSFSFAEVVKGLKEGKRFKRIDWRENVFIKMVKAFYFPTTKIVNQYGVGCQLWIEDYEANDWVEVKE